jgi:hypothetical protein
MTAAKQAVTQDRSTESAMSNGESGKQLEKKNPKVPKLRENNTMRVWHTEPISENRIVIVDKNIKNKRNGNDPAGTAETCTQHGTVILQRGLSIDNKRPERAGVQDHARMCPVCVALQSK